MVPLRGAVINRIDIESETHLTDTRRTAWSGDLQGLTPVDRTHAYSLQYTPLFELRIDVRQSNFPGLATNRATHRPANRVPTARESHQVDGNRWDVSLTYSNVQYIRSTGSSITNAASFNTADAVLRRKPMGRAWCAAHYKETKRAPKYGRQRTDIHQ